MRRMRTQGRPQRILGAAALWLAGALLASDALAQSASPFLPAAAPKPKILRLLAPTEAIDAGLLADFERASGWAVAYDAYDMGDSIPERWREGPYDLVLLAGPDLQKRILAGALAKIDRAKVAAAKMVHPAVAAKLAAYDAGGVFAVAYGWSPFGLLYDAEKTQKRWGGAPVSWSQVFLPRDAARMTDCGIALPNARDDIFVAAWRLLSIDPARATLNDVKTAGALLEKTRPSLAAFAASDIVGAMAKGSVCLSAGAQGEADAAEARARLGGTPSSFRFAFPREGGPVMIEAFALPKDAPHAEPALALLEYLLKPENWARGVKLAGLVNARDAGPAEVMKRLSPEPVFDEKMNAALEAEWKHLKTGK